jgi:ankyrin repeat protein
VTDELLSRIAEGRTDLVFEWVAKGGAATAAVNGMSLIGWCAYYGDVSALRFLVANGESLTAIGDDLGLNGASFHGHWRLCQFLLEQGADPNHALPDTGETPLHSALCKPPNPAADRVVAVLLAHGADPRRATKPGAETGAFMRDVRTRGETALHRAAAFGSEEAIRRLLDQGADVSARDAHGDTALSWASYHLRPDSVLRLLVHGRFTVRPDRKTMEECLLGEPQSPPSQR